MVKTKDTMKFPHKITREKHLKINKVQYVFDSNLK